MKVFLNVAALGLIAAGSAARADTIYTYSCPASSPSACGNQMSLNLDMTTGTGSYQITGSASGQNGPVSVYDAFTFNPANATITNPNSTPSIAITGITVLPQSFVLGSGGPVYYKNSTPNNGLQVYIGGGSINGNTIAGQITLSGGFQQFAASQQTSVYSFLTNYIPPSNSSSSSSTSSSTGGTPVPEPGMLGLVALGSASLMWRRRKRLAKRAVSSAPPPA